MEISHRMCDKIDRVFPEIALHFMTENWKPDSMLKHAKLKHKRSSKLQLNLQLLLHYSPKNMKEFKTELLYSFYLLIKCDIDKDSTYDQEALPALRSRDSRASIAQARIPAPTSCFCPWLGENQIQRHDRHKVWIHSTERYKQEERRKDYDMGHQNVKFPGGFILTTWWSRASNTFHKIQMRNVLKPTFAEKSQNVWCIWDNAIKMKYICTQWKLDAFLASSTSKQGRARRGWQVARPLHCHRPVDLIRRKSQNKLDFSPCNLNTVSIHPALVSCTRCCLPSLAVQDSILS